MQHDILIPKVGMTMTEATMVEWLAADGAVVTAGAPVLLIETDKSTIEVEAPASGTLSHGAAIDSVVKLGTVVGTVTAA